MDEEQIALYQQRMNDLADEGIPSTGGSEAFSLGGQKTLKTKEQLDKEAQALGLSSLKELFSPQEAAFAKMRAAEPMVQEALAKQAQAGQYAGLAQYLKNQTGGKQDYTGLFKQADPMDMAKAAQESAAKEASMAGKNTENQLKLLGLMETTLPSQSYRKSISAPKDKGRTGVMEQSLLFRMQKDAKDSLMKEADLVASAENVVDPVITAARAAGLQNVNSLQDAYKAGFVMPGLEHENLVMNKFADFLGNGLGLENISRTVLPPETQTFLTSVQSMINDARNKKFGSALTATEAAEFQKELTSVQHGAQMYQVVNKWMQKAARKIDVATTMYKKIPDVYKTVVEGSGMSPDQIGAKFYKASTPQAASGTAPKGGFKSISDWKKGQTP